MFKLRETILFFDENKTFSEYECLLDFVSEERREKIAAFPRDGDKLRSLFTEMLIRKDISERFKAPPDCFVIKKDEHGKPFIEGSGGFGFSVSHSGGAVALSSGFSPSGIDIEKIRPHNPRVSTRFFTENERIAAETSDEAFFEIWTKKEAYSKMTGKGIGEVFSSFDVTDKSLPCKFYTYKKDGYIYSACTTAEKRFTVKILTEEELIGAMPFRASPRRFV